MVVTGAAGFIGSHLCDQLLAEGHEVLGVDNFSSFYARRLKEENLWSARRSPQFHFQELDLAECDLDALIAGAAGVFHLAGQAGVRGSWGDTFTTYTRDNLDATQRLLEALRRHNVPAVIASSSSVYGNGDRRPVTELSVLRPASPYGLTKLAVEHLVRIYVEQYGVEVVTLRYFTVFGPRQRPDMAFTRFLTAAVHGAGIQLLGDGRQTRDFTYVSDIVDATRRSLGGRPGAVYNVGGGHPASIAEVVEVIAELAGAQLSVERRPAAAGDVSHTWADTTLARRELGWTPRVALLDGLRSQLDWVRGQVQIGAVA